MEIFTYKFPIIFSKRSKILNRLENSHPWGKRLKNLHPSRGWIRKRFEQCITRTKLAEFDHEAFLDYAEKANDMQSILEKIEERLVAFFVIAFSIYIYKGPVHKDRYRTIPSTAGQLAIWCGVPLA